MANLDMVAEAFWLVAANVVKKAGEEFESHVKAGLSEDQAYEECCKTFETLIKTCALKCGICFVGDFLMMMVLVVNL